MTQEEKARAYDEALEKAETYYDNAKVAGDYSAVARYENMFPVLLDSDDERIRKCLVAMVNCQIWDSANSASKKECLAWLEKQKERKPIKMEVYEIGKGTTICGQDYKCKKDYKEGNCWYIKDAIYHCNRDGYLTDQNGVSWSCTPEWFNEYIQSNTEWAEEEKTRFVSGQFLQCKLSFDGFKEGEHYWLEYVGDDTYVGRSDNILNQKFHITPRQLFTLFSQELEEKQKEQKPAEWSEEDEAMMNNILRVLSCFVGSVECESDTALSTSYPLYMREMDWLKSLRKKFKKED